MERERRDGRRTGPARALALIAALAMAGEALAQAPRAVRPGITAENRAAFEALDAAQRRAIQDDLLWTGDYAGTVDGVFGPRTFEAIVAWQRRLRLPQSGILTARDRAELAAQAQAAREEAGFARVDDPRSGARLGLPLALMTRRSDAPGPNGGTRWQTADEGVTLDTRVFAPGESTLAELYDRLTATRIAGRNVTYSVLREDFLVVSGETAQGKFYVRYDSGASGIRGFSIGYAKTLAPRFDALTLAIANSFEAFPTGAAPVAHEGTSGSDVASAPAPYASGLVIGPDAVLTSVAVDACARLLVGGAEAGARRRVGDAALIVTVPHGRAVVSLSLSEPADMGEAVMGEAVALAASGEGGLAVVPGAIEEGRFFAPVQPGATGAPVFDRSGALVGLVGEVARDPVRVAGVAPPAAAALVPAASFAVELEDAPSPDAGGRWTAGRLSRSYGGLVVALDCAD